MKIIVTDTNVFIDLIQSNALDAFFECSFEVCTTDLVLFEIRSPNQRPHLDKHVLSGRLKVLELSEEEIAEAAAMQTQCNLKRITDKSVLLKAIQMQACLLTGDGDLRKEGQRAGLDVRGSLWVIKEIWSAGILGKVELLNILESLSQNTRLPQGTLADLKHDIQK
jgi:predicted nucleic acid-binding protein